MSIRLAILAWQLLGALSVLATSACAHQPPAARPEVQAVALTAGAERIGELRLDGAWSLSADMPEFGGISGARITGDRLLLLSDRSHLFELAWAWPMASRSFQAPLLGQRALADRRGRPLDAEALALGPDGRLLVADEGASRVIAFAGERVVGKATGLQELAPAGSNTGIEAIELLPGGDLLALAEDGDAGLRVSRDARHRLRYRAAEGFRPTDLAAVPPWLFVLERRLSLFGGWQARLVAVPLAVLDDGSDPVIEGRELATISGGRLGENYEALAAVRGPEGFRLMVVSDDNFNAFQRTLLLSLLWVPDAAPVAAARP